MYGSLVSVKNRTEKEARRTDNQFFDRPILNSPYATLSATGSSTTRASDQQIKEISPSGPVHHPIPSRAAAGAGRCRSSNKWCSTRAPGFSSAQQQYGATSIIQRGAR